MKFLLVAVLLFSPGAVAAVPADRGHAKLAQSVDPNFNFVFDSIELRELVRLFWWEVFDESLLLDGDLLKDDTRVSVNVRGMKKPETRAFMASLLANNGYVVERVAGTKVAQFRKIAKPPDPEEETPEPYIYYPKYRSVGYLMDVLGSHFNDGEFLSRRSVRAASTPSPQTPGAKPDIQTARPPASSVGAASGGAIGARQESARSASTLVDREVDAFVFVGKKSDRKKLEVMLAQLDRPVPEFYVRATVYEIASGVNKSDTLGLVVDLFKSRAKLSAGVSVENGAVKLSLGGITAVLDVFDSDGRFKSLTRPNLRVRSGGSGRMAVGSEVPVLSSRSVDRDGRPLQTVEYKNAGVIFDVSLLARQEVVDLKVAQTLSEAVATLTGVSDSPTFNKRELLSSMSLKSGEVVILGGLRRENNNLTNTWFRFAPVFGSSGDRSETSELILVLSVERV